MVDFFATLLGGFGAGLLAFFTSVRSIYSQDVVKERQAWREKIRALSSEALEAVRDGNIGKLTRVRHEFAIRLNPGFLEDKKILCCLSTLQDNPSRQEKEITGRISFLLKHDWERVKLESNIIKRLYIIVEPVDWEEKYSCLEDGPNFRRTAWCRILVPATVIVAIIPSAVC